MPHPKYTADQAVPTQRRNVFRYPDDQEELRFTLAPGKDWERDFCLPWRRQPEHTREDVNIGAWFAWTIEGYMADGCPFLDACRTAYHGFAVNTDILAQERVRYAAFTMLASLWAYQREFTDWANKEARFVFSSPRP